MAQEQEQLKKTKPEIKLGATVRLRVHSGEIVEGRVVHLWEEKYARMVRVATGDLVYNVPASTVARNGHPTSAAREDTKTYVVSFDEIISLRIA